MMARQLVRRRPDGLPVYGYEPSPGLPPVGTVDLADAHHTQAIPPAEAHAHDFFVIVFFERDGGALRIGWRDWPIAAGDVYLVAPGDVVDIGPDVAEFCTARGRAVHFSPEIFGAMASDSMLSWWEHPLLLPLVPPAIGEPKRWTVPPADRAAWSAGLEVIDRELSLRRPGHREAVAASLTLLLVDAARLAQAGPPSLPPSADPRVVEVFAYIDEHYREQISLRDVARAVNLSSGHLTTVIGRRTGRTVQAWITQRRLTEARRLLVDTDLPVDEIGRRSGYRDPSYFARSFGKAHGTTLLAWRQAAHGHQGSAPC